VRPRRRIRTGPIGLWLAAIVVVSAVVQFLLGRRVVAPWIMVDELIYSDMARSFAATGHFLIRGVHGDYGPVYPAILALAYKVTGTVPDAYTAGRAINAPLMSLAAIPAYFLARRVLRPWAALAAAALAVAIPSMAYVGTLMTENAFYPLFVCVALALVLMLERPTVWRQLAALALCAVAFETRAQAVALVAAVATAPLVLAWIERGRPGRLRAYKVLYGTLAAAVVAVIVVELARGRSPLDALGNYSATGHVSYAPWPAFRWLVYHLAELDLSLWLLPFAALIVVVASARHLDARVRAFAAAAATISVWLLLEVSVFASHYSGRIEERNLFYLAPLFLTALLVWIDRGQPRPPRVTVAAAGLAAVLPGALPFARLLRVDAESDTIGLQPWWYLGGAWTGVHGVGVAVVLVSLALGAAFLWLPARYAAALPAIVAVGFLATWLPLEQWKHGFPRVSTGTYFQGLKDQSRNWIDRKVGADADVAAIWTNRSGNRFTIWQNEFWNKSVRRVYDVGAKMGGGMPEIPVLVRRQDGLLTRADTGEPLRAPYVLTDDSFAVVGTPIARDRARGMVLYRVTPPVRSTRRIVGLYDDGWSQPTLTWTQAGCRGGTLRVSLHGDSSLFPNGQTVVARGARVVRVRVPTNSETTLAVPVGSSCTVTFRVLPTARPSDVLGGNDTREVGTHFDRFDYSAG
jgi:hypothetical protein